MAATAGPADGNWFGFTTGQIVQEFGYDDDVDSDLRAAIEATTGAELAYEDHEDVVDGTIIWWRADDAEAGDLTDLLVDAMGNLDDGGLIWVLTPKPGRPGHVTPADVAEAADTAGLQATSAVSAGANWAGFRLLARGRGR
ncbi:DUF3052 domain-containing protein [Georgenia faecalis]|uniref:DUF3052 domain-containing protein n=1 Tax=Georgenia faecalis TaxID=2483799 RepID=A0ABV9D943_9MICO|nr:DUF3052 domain-containing protein [Georgenia faecalis]